MARKIEDLPDIEFIDVDAEAIKQEIMQSYKRITGRDLSRGDPVRLFLLFQTEVIVRLLHLVNDTAKQNLLRYARGNVLELLGANIWTTRLQATPAIVTIEATLAEARLADTILPKGTRISDGGEVAFAIDKSLVIQAGQTTGRVTATCLQVGTMGNNYAIGEICHILDPIPYVKDMHNINVSAGGSDIETDEALRQRIWEAPERFSTAGPAGAYRALIMSLNASIADVEATSLDPGCVDIYILLHGGKPPDDALLEDIAKNRKLNDSRPLTDNVRLHKPEVVPYNVDVTYLLDTNADAAKVQVAMTEAVSQYASTCAAKLGCNVDPSELTRRLRRVVGVENVKVRSPEYMDVQRSQVATMNSMQITMAGSVDGT